MGKKGGVCLNLCRGMGNRFTIFETLLGVAERSMMKKCSKCGRENADDLFYCAKCGSPLPKTEADVKREVSSKRVIMFVEIVAALLATFVFVAMPLISGEMGFGAILGAIVVSVLLAVVVATWYLSRD
ncbi:MAG: hypothetical protein AB1476_03930 [Candidatus Hadarchaeota archaeon]